MFQQEDDGKDHCVLRLEPQHPKDESPQERATRGEGHEAKTEGQHEDDVHLTTQNAVVQWYEAEHQGGRGQGECSTTQGQSYRQNKAQQTEGGPDQEGHRKWKVG